MNAASARRCWDTGFDLRFHSALMDTFLLIGRTANIRTLCTPR